MINKKMAKYGYVAVKKCRYGFFAYNTNDTFIGKSLDLYGEWAQTELDVLLPVIEPNDIIVDVGAYIGTHSIPFAKRCLPNGGVYAIEPQRLSFAFLNTNITLNNLMNIIALNKFADKKIGKMRFLSLDQTYPQNFGSYPTKNCDTGDVIDVITIDSLNLSRVKLIKIDVEGQEVNVLLGATATINKFKPILYVECTNPKKTKSIISTVFNLNYQAYWHISSYYNPNNFFGNKKDVFSSFHPEVNIICFPKNAIIEQNMFLKVKSINDTWKKAIKRITIP